MQSDWGVERSPLSPPSDLQGLQQAPSVEAVEHWTTDEIGVGVSQVKKRS